jgi:hypothetical protein
MTTAIQQIEKLNRGEHVPTYQMVQVAHLRSPITGELRYLQPFVPAPGEPLASMVPLRPVRIVWTGEKWGLA